MEVIRVAFLMFYIMTDIYIFLTVMSLKKLIKKNILVQLLQEVN